MYLYLTGPCDRCSDLHGTCVSGFCRCDVGWEGPKCDRQGKTGNKIINAQTTSLSIHPYIPLPFIF